MSRLRRVMLFSPGDSLRKIEKAAGLTVDCLILDVEDGVALTQKAEARQTISHALKNLDFGTTERLVRINPVGSGIEMQDLKSTINARPDGYVIPKVEQAKDIKQISKWLDAEERKNDWKVGSIRLFAIIETARSVVNVKKIAKSSSRLEALMFGAEDFAGSIGAMRTPEGAEVFFARSSVLTHAKAFGLQAIDTPYIDIHNLDGLKSEAEKIVQMGFDGKLAIHPQQIPVIEAAFMPSAEEIEKAQALIAAHDAHQKSGTGVFAFEGKMVDMPVVLAAENILKRAGQLER